MKKESDLQIKNLRNYDNYDKTSNRKPTKKMIATGCSRRLVEDLFEKKEFEAMFDLF